MIIPGRFPTEGWSQTTGLRGKEMAQMGADSLHVRIRRCSKTLVGFLFWRIHPILSVLFFQFMMVRNIAVFLDEKQKNNKQQN